MKYRIEVQQVFGTSGVQYDVNARWAELDDKPRGKAAAIALMEAGYADAANGAPRRVVAIDAQGERVEVARLESEHKPAPMFAVEVVTVSETIRQEFATLKQARALFLDLVAGVESDPRTGYTRSITLVGLASGDTYFKWEYEAPQEAPTKSEFDAHARTVTVEKAGQTFTFRVKFDHDAEAGAPWENEDGHGPVTSWERRDKLPGELILNEDRSSKRFYDFAEACRIALRDGWNAQPYPTTPETKRQQAARAARADYEHLREWCANQWDYVVVTVTLLDDDGEETDVGESLGCVEDRNDYHHKTAVELAEGLAQGYGSTWGRVERQTFAMLAQGE